MRRSSSLLLRNLSANSSRSCRSSAAKLASTTSAPQTQFSRSLNSARSFSSAANNEQQPLFQEDDAMADAFDYEVIEYPESQAKISQPAPGFTAPAVVDGEISTVSLKSFRGKWTVLFFYPKDFTFVCPTEIIAFSDRFKEFEALNAQLIACSTDTQESHLAWTRLPRSQGGLGTMNIPIVADVTKKISSLYGVLNEEVGIAFRGLFIINPDGVLEQSTINNFPVGRSVDETLRLLQAFQFVAEHGEVCPANWKPGDKTIVANPEDSQEYFASGATEGIEASAAAASSLTSISTKAEFDEIVSSKKPIVFDFMAPWCGKCTQMLPFVESLAEKHGEVKFVKIDTTLPEMEALKDSMDVHALPAYRFFKDGAEVSDLPAVTGYKKKLLAQQVEKLL